MALASKTTTAYVVRDAEHGVVLAFWGADAAQEAATWAERGYSVEIVDANQFLV